MTPRRTLKAATSGAVNTLYETSRRFRAPQFQNEKNLTAEEDHAMGLKLRETDTVLRGPLS